jgi:hypothetical protein
MRKLKITIAIFLVGIVCSCNNNKTSEVSTNDSKQASSGEMTNQPASSTTTQSEDNGTDGLIGRWQLQSNAFDGNKNKVLDPEERAAATPNSSSYLFRKDGSCLVQGSLKGHYELKKENGAELLNVFRERIPEAENEDPAPERFRIFSVNSTELVLLSNYSGNQQTFFILKRG